MLLAYQTHFFLAGCMFLVFGLCSYDPRASYQLKVQYLYTIWFISLAVVSSVLITSLVPWTYSLLFSYFCVFPLKKILFIKSFFTLYQPLYSLFSNMLLVLFLLWFLVSSKDLLNPALIRYEFFSISMFSFCGAFLIMSATHFLSLYLSIEFFSICTYILIAFYRKSKLAAEAAFKYFTISALGTSFLLLGMSFLYGSSGIIDFIDLSLFLNGKIVLSQLDDFSWAGILLLYSAIFLKLGAAPFHLWLADVYEGSLNIVLIYMAIISKWPFFFFLIRMNIDFFYILFDVIKYGIMIVSMLSLLFGAFGAVQQLSFKRFFAYSGINHMGYILLGTSIGTSFSLFAIWNYVYIYSISTAALLGTYIYLINQSVDSKPTTFVFTNLYKRDLLCSIIFITILFSYIGLPPLAGFYAKYYLFLAGMNAEMFFLVLYASLISMLSTVYYIRIIKSIMFNAISTYIER